LRQPKQSPSAAWRNLADAMARAGDAAGADAAYAAYAAAAADDAELMRAAVAVVDGKRGLAERLLRARLHSVPSDIAAMRLLADNLQGLGRVPEAETLLERALQLAPSFAAARHTYATLLFRNGRAAQAIAHVERLLAQDGENGSYKTLLASCHAMAGQYERAISLYEEVLKQTPDQPKVWLSYGNALRHVGRLADGIRAYRTCLGIAPGSGEAYWSLANLQTEKFTADDVAAMRAQLARRDLAPADRFHIDYALGHALEQAGDYAGSFAHYAAGAKLRRTQLRYNANDTTNYVRRAAAYFTAARLAAAADAASVSPVPIFVLGMPRAGSTLVEQILASHSAVEGTKELYEIDNIATELVRQRGGGHAQAYPGCIDGLDAAALAELGAGYLQRTRIYRRTDRPFFIDKMPGNWVHAGLIHLILPRALIIDARRAPMANCFAAFKQHFAHGMSYSYDLTELGRYYRDYVAYMEHFDAVAPGRIHVVRYEALVEDTEGEIRRMLDYCGLAFEAGCLRFWQTERAVGTVSSEQVRRPIFRSALEQWRNYEPWLGPLQAALGIAGDGAG
jgi:tetratricopeptide (TPR) repeat protein